MVFCRLCLPSTWDVQLYVQLGYKRDERGWKPVLRPRSMLNPFIHPLPHLRPMHDPPPPHVGVARTEGLGLPGRLPQRGGKRIVLPGLTLCCLRAPQ
jgi:hypothetical protein